MAAFDWNGDGKINLYDDMLELHNAKESMKNEPSSFFNEKDYSEKSTTPAGDSQVSGVSIAAALILGLLATLWVCTKVDLMSPLVVILVFGVMSFISLIVCMFIEAVIIAFRDK